MVVPEYEVRQTGGTRYVANNGSGLAFQQGRVRNAHAKTSWSKLTDSKLPGPASADPNREVVLDVAAVPNIELCMLRQNCSLPGSPSAPPS